MNNQELEKRIKEIINIDNFFDMVIAANKFEKIYKASDFYKETKMPLNKVIENTKKWYMFNINEIQQKVQSFLDNLSLEHLEKLIGDLGDTFENENQETQEMIDTIKTLANN